MDKMQKGSKLEHAFGERVKPILHSFQESKVTNRNRREIVVVRKCNTNEINEDHDDVYSAVSSLRFICRIFGMAPNNWDKSNPVPSFSASVYSSVFILILIADSIMLLCYKLYSVQSIHSNSIADWLEQIMMSLLALTAVVRARPWGRSSVASALAHLQSVDAATTKHPQDVLKERRHCRNLLTSVFTINFCIIIIDLVTFTLKKGGYFCPEWGFYLFCIMYPPADLQFPVLTRMLANRFKRLNDQLLAYPPTAEEIWRLRIQHDRLCDCAELINEHFGTTMTMSIAASFCNMMSANLETVTVVTSRGLSISTTLRVALVMVLSSVVLLRLVVLIIIAGAAHAAVTEAKRPAVLAHKLQLQVPGDPTASEVIMQLEAFGRAPRQRPIRFTAAGFFTLDRPLVGAVIGTLVTYLVVIVQFDLLEK